MKNELNITTKFISKEKSLEKYKEQYPDGLVIKGYANKAIIDSVGDIVLPSAYDLKRADIMPLLYNHDKDKVVGKILELNIKTDGLEIIAYVDPIAEEEFKLISKIQKELLRAFSIGFIIKDAEWDNESGVFIIKELELYEVSVVSVPANAESTIVDMKSLEKFKDKSKSKNHKLDKGGIKMEELKLLFDEIKGLKETVTKSQAPEVTKEQFEGLVKQLDELKAEKEELLKKIDEMKELAPKTEDVVKSVKEEFEKTKSIIDELKEEIKELKEAKPQVKVLEADEKTIEAHMEDYSYALMASQLYDKDLKDTKVFQRLPERAKSVTLDSAFTTKVNKKILTDIKTNTSVAQLLQDFSDISTTNEEFPFAIDSTAAFGSLTLQNADFSNKITFSLKSLMNGVEFSYAADEESIIDWLPMLKQKLTEAIADRFDQEILCVTASTSGFTGILGYANDAGLTYVDASTTNLLTLASIRGARKLMGKYAIKPKDVVCVLNSAKYFQLLDDTTLQTADKFANEATLLTGEVAKVEGISIILTEEISLNDTDLADNFSALLFNRKLFGYKLKDIRVEMDKNIQTQNNVIVMSVRCDMKPLVPSVSSTYSICAAVENA